MKYYSRQTTLTGVEPQAVPHLGSPPILSDDDRKELFLLPHWLEEELSHIRKPPIQIGLCIQFFYFQITRRFFTPEEYLAVDKTYIAYELLDIPNQKVTNESYSPSNRSKHKALILAHEGYKDFDSDFRDELSSYLGEILKGQMREKNLYEIALEYTGNNKVAFPSDNFAIARLVKSAKRCFLQNISQKLERDLPGSIILIFTL